MSDLAPGPQNHWMHREFRHVYLAAGAVLVALVCSMGCLNLQFGGKQCVTEDTSVSAQNGSTKILKGQVAQIYYPRSYAAPPNLELEQSQSFEIVEQKADHFRVRVRDGSSGPLEVKWTARGTLMPPPTAAPHTAESPPATPTTTTTANR